MPYAKIRGSMDHQSVFSGLKVLELSSVLAGPAVGMFFAELGAKVTKVENSKTGGDVTRSWKVEGEDLESSDSAYYHAVNWNKDVHFLDLTETADRNKAHNWVGECDIVIANFKHGSSQKLGMDYATLKEINPGLIYGSISAYGKDDPRPGFDVSMQAETGWVYMNGNEDGPPTKMPVALIDVLAAHQLKEGLMIALMNRMKDGKGSEVHVSLYKSSIASLANQASNWLNLNILPKRMGSKHPNICPYGDILSTRDLVEVMLTAGTQNQFEVLCAILDQKELISDPSYMGNAERVTNRNELILILQKAISKWSWEELESNNPKLRSVMVPIQNMEQVFRNPEARKMILSEDEPIGNPNFRVATVAFEIDA